MRTKRAQKGVTLIEVLVAFMILSMSLTVIFTIVSGGLRNVALSVDYARAVLLAESQLSAIGVTEPLQRGVTSGEWGERFHWERVVEHYQPWEQDRELDAPLQGYRVTVRVDWKHAGRSRQITLNSVRLKQAKRTAGSG